MEKGKELNAKALDVGMICFKIKELITGECKVHSFDLPKEKQAEVDHSNSTINSSIRQFNSIGP